MTADQLEEIRALRARLAQLEQMAVQAGKEPTSMYGSNPPPERDERRAADAARRFVPDAQMERFLELKTKGDPKYDALSPSVRTALGFYVSTKEQAEAHERRQRGR